MARHCPKQSAARIQRELILIRVHTRGDRRAGDLLGEVMIRPCVVRSEARIPRPAIHVKVPWYQNLGRTKKDYM